MQLRDVRFAGLDLARLTRSSALESRLDGRLSGEIHGLRTVEEAGGAGIAARGAACRGAPASTSNRRASAGS